MLSSKTTQDGYALAHVDCTICSDDSNRLHSDVRAVLLTLFPSWTAHDLAIEQCKGSIANLGNLPSQSYGSTCPSFVPLRSQTPPSAALHRLACML